MGQGYLFVDFLEGDLSSPAIGDGLTQACSVRRCRRCRMCGDRLFHNGQIVTIGCGGNGGRYGRR